MYPHTVSPEQMQQRMAALRKANVIRMDRSQLKKDLKAGKVPIFDLLLEPPERLASMKIIDLILAAPKHGRVRANKVLRQCQISTSRELGGLTSRERAEIISKMH
jgi:hypothetical protein